MIAAKCGSTCVLHNSAPVFLSNARIFAPGPPPKSTPPCVPTITLSSVTAGVTRALSRDAPLASGMLAVHLTAPVILSTAYRLPAQSGKYTVLASTAGVAETSLAVVNSHFTWSPLTLATPSLCSDSWSRVFWRLPPAEVHSLPPAADPAPGSSNVPASAIATHKAAKVHLPLRIALPFPGGTQRPRAPVPCAASIRWAGRSSQAQPAMSTSNRDAAGSSTASASSASRSRSAFAAFVSFTNGIASSVATSFLRRHHHRPATIAVEQDRREHVTVLADHLPAGLVVEHPRPVGVAEEDVVPLAEQAQRRGCVGRRARGVAEVVELAAALVGQPLQLRLERLERRCDRGDGEARERREIGTARRPERRKRAAGRAWSSLRLPPPPARRATPQPRRSGCAARRRAPRRRGRGGSARSSVRGARRDRRPSAPRARRGSAAARSPRAARRA